MPKLGLEGPWDLNDRTIDQEVTNHSAGNYALGYENERGAFVVKYVGRSDDDLNARLHDWTDNGQYHSFKASYASSPTAAYKRECQNFHDFGGADKLDNKYHPDKPDGGRVSCPVCGE